MKVVASAHTFSRETARFDNGNSHSWLNFSAVSATHLSEQLELQQLINSLIDSRNLRRKRTGWRKGKRRESFSRSFTKRKAKNLRFVQSVNRRVKLIHYLTKLIIFVE